MADTNNETSPAASALVVKGIHVGSPVPVDAELDSTSDNPVNNKAVCEKFDEIDEELILKYTRFTKLFSRQATAIAGGETLSIPHMNEYKWIYIVNQFDATKLVPVIANHIFTLNADFTANQTIYFSKCRVKIDTANNQLIVSDGRGAAYGDGATTTTIWGIREVYGIK